MFLIVDGDDLRDLSFRIRTIHKVYKQILIGKVALLPPYKQNCIPIIPLVFHTVFKRRI